MALSSTKPAADWRNPDGGGSKRHGRSPQFRFILARPCAGGNGGRGLDMEPKGSTRWLFWLCLASVSAGCSGEDTDRLARVYHRAAAKLEDGSAGTRDKLSRGWHSLQGDPLAAASLRDRVAARLRLDRALADASIEVDADGDVITLRGEVDAEQRRRAINLAESTI